MGAVEYPVCVGSSVWLSSHILCMSLSVNQHQHSRGKREIASCLGHECLCLLDWWKLSSPMNLCHTILHVLWSAYTTELYRSRAHWVCIVNMCSFTHMYITLCLDAVFYVYIYCIHLTPVLLEKLRSAFVCVCWTLRDELWCHNIYVHMLIPYPGRPLHTCCTLEFHHVHCGLGVSRDSLWRIMTSTFNVNPDLKLSIVIHEA